MTITGVLIKPLKKVVNDKGHLLEVQRIDDPEFSVFGQAYITCTNPSITKAWYRHHKQTDQIAILKGKMVLVLYDTREGHTKGILQQIVLDEANPVLVQIPPGIWHGFKNSSMESAYLIHLNTLPFSFEDTDEDRLSPEDPIIPFRWSAI